MWDEEIPDINSGVQDDNPDAVVTSLPDVSGSGGGKVLDLIGSALDKILAYNVQKDQTEFNNALLRSGRAVYDPTLGTMRFLPSSPSLSLPAVSGNLQGVLVLALLAVAGVWAFKKFA